MQKSSSPFEHRELPRPRDGWRELLLRQLLASTFLGSQAPLVNLNRTARFLTVTLEMRR